MSLLLQVTTVQFPALHSSLFPPKACPLALYAGLRGWRTQGDRGSGSLGGRRRSTRRAERRGWDRGEGEGPGVGEGRGGRVSGSRRAVSGVRSPWQCWAQPEVSRPLPSPPRSPPLAPLPISSCLLSAPTGPSSPATCCFYPGELVGGTREELPNLTPSRRRAKGAGPRIRPGVPQIHPPTFL